MLHKIFLHVYQKFSNLQFGSNRKLQSCIKVVYTVPRLCETREEYGDKNVLYMTQYVPNEIDQNENLD